MYPEVAARAESLPAVTAGVWALVPVDSEMVDAFAAVGGETAAAHRTAEWALPTVHAHVSTQVGAFGEVSATDIAAEAPPTACSWSLL